MWGFSCLSPHEVKSNDQSERVSEGKPNQHTGDGLKGYKMLGVMPRFLTSFGNSSITILTGSFIYICPSYIHFLKGKPQFIDFVLCANTVLNFSTCKNAFNSPNNSVNWVLTVLSDLMTRRVRDWTLRKCPRLFSWGWTELAW